MADWQPLLVTDLLYVNRIADIVHTSLPERPEVFEEKVRLFPTGCQKLVSGKSIVGYGISHPWMHYSIPPLDEFLHHLPEASECMYLHDVVVLPEARGQGATGRYVDFVKGVAREIGTPLLALVSVYGTDTLWSRFGFKVVQNPSLDLKLISYGRTAKYMVCECND
jgi:hypothetical protein